VDGADKRWRARGGLVPGAMVGEYRVEMQLGQGGMATVFGAVHPLIGKRAAIKVMSPILSLDENAVGRFIREAQAVNRIGHPNIVDVFSFGELEDGRCYLVMEWLRGETLYDRLARVHRLPLGDVVHIVDQVCDALEAAHENGIIHRDLKPANVFLATVKGRPDRVKLLDFGVAKLVHEDGPRYTTLDCVLGTPEYISPEQARGRDIDARADLYSLGVMAYEMVLGRLPFLSDNPADAIQMHLAATPPRPRILWPTIPAPLEAVLLGLLAKDRTQRPSLATVRAVLADLVPAPSELHAVSVPRLRWRRRRGQLLRAGAVVATSLTLLLVGYRPVPAPLHAQAPAGRAVADVAPPPPPSAAPMAPALTPRAAPRKRASHAASTVEANSPRRAKKLHKNVRDGNYLLYPFGSH
jgi:serine/threonine-protein kinase